MPILEPSTDAATKLQIGRWTFAAVVVVVGALVAAVTLYFAGDDDTTEQADPTPSVTVEEPASTPGDDTGVDSPASPLPILLGDDLDASLNAGLARFPLFDREWDLELLVGNSSGGLDAIDLSTGDKRTLDDIARVDDVRSIGDDLYISTGWEIFRVSDQGITRVRGRSPGSGFVTLLDDYWTADNFRVGPVSLNHLVTGAELPLADIAHFVVVDDAVLGAKGGAIVRIDADGEQPWAVGEILTSGPTGLTWRECDESACEYWAGSPDEPRRRRLDAATAGETLILSSFRSATGLDVAGIPDLLSPSLQTAVTFDLEDESRLAFSLTDLTTGDTVRVSPAEGPPTFLPDESAMFLSVGNAVVAIDTATGDVARILTDDGSLFGIIPKQSS